MFTFGLGRLLWVMLLLTNAVAILSHDRFLVPLGLTTSSTAPLGSSSSSSGMHHMMQGGNNYGFDSYSSGPGGGQRGMSSDGPSIKHRLVILVSAVRTLMRIPLIPLNILVILYELVLG